MLDINLTCRTCMKENVTLINLYEKVKAEENISMQLSEMLQKCTNTRMQEGDGLPQKLCDKCVMTLKMIYTFQKQVIKAEEEFRKLLRIQLDVKHELPDDTYSLKLENDLECYATQNDFGLNILPKDEDGADNSNFSFLDSEFKDEFKIRNSPPKKKKRQTCLHCQKVFFKRKVYEKHIGVCIKKTLDIKTESHSENQEVYQCPNCDVSYSKHRSLAMHMKKHKNSNFQSYICNICSKSFTYKHLLRRHMKIHEQKRQYECGECHKSFVRKDHLTTHVMSNHGALKPYICPICRKDFPQQCNLKDHIRIHTGETPFLCSECGKGFANVSNLRQHVFRHAGVKPFTCNSCPKSFCTKGQLQCHMSTHTGLRPYKCEECGSAFTKPGSLKKHLIIHTGIKPYACESCNRRFTCKDHLKRHERIHTGEKPYRCTMCERAFTQSNDLLKHVRSHVGQNIYQCTICGDKFRLARELKLHYPVHFGGHQPDDHQGSQLSDPKAQAAEDISEVPKNDDPAYTILIHSCNPGDISINVNTDKN